MRKIGYLLVIIVISFVLLGCTNTTEELNLEERYPQEVGERFLRRLYAEEFNFWTFRQGEGGGTIIASLMYTGYLANHPSFAKDFMIEFVYDEEQALRIVGESIVPVWASPYTERLLYSLNYAVVENNINLCEFNLTHPIVMRDIIENWEDVSNLLENTEREMYSGVFCLTFYVDRLLAEVEGEMLEKLEYSWFWGFRSLSISKEIQKPSLVSVSISRGTHLNKRAYAWHIEEYGLDFSEIIFANTKEEAEVIGSEVFAMFPHISPWLEKQLEDFNNQVAESNINLTEFSLAYPVTVEDLVDNWEGINKVMSLLDLDYY